MKLINDAEFKDPSMLSDKLARIYKMLEGIFLSTQQTPQILYNRHNCILSWFAIIM